MRKLLCALAFSTTCLLNAQSPILKVYVNTQEVSASQCSISAYVKSGGTYYPILDSSRKKISVPKGMDISRFEALKFIVAKDTLEFIIAQILEDHTRKPDRTPLQDLNDIFNSLKQWDLRIDSFRYTNAETLSSGKQNISGKNNIYKEYKIYALRTKYLKYYIVKT